jgi:hypothetical protein
LAPYFIGEGVQLNLINVVFARGITDDLGQPLYGQYYWDMQPSGAATIHLNMWLPNMNKDWRRSVLVATAAHEIEHAAQQIQGVTKAMYDMFPNYDTNPFEVQALAKEEAVFTAHAWLTDHGVRPTWND